MTSEHHQLKQFVIKYQQWDKYGRPEEGAHVCVPVFSCNFSLSLVPM
jgi:hypothetical protein